MIAKIVSLKEFGVFKNYRWGVDLPEFNRFNLIYGWNYSGKTTLSRAFRCLELRENHPDFFDASGEIKLRAGVTLTLTPTGKAPEVRVFNTDFVRDNLKFETGTATSFVVLGSEDIAKRELLAKKRDELARLKGAKDENELQRSTKNRYIADALTAVARDAIKNPLAIPNYDRTRLEKKVEYCKENPTAYFLPADLLETCLTVYQSKDKKPLVPTAVASLSSVASLRGKAEALLLRVVVGNKPIDRLAANPEIELWVRQGRPLHDGKTNCEFCGQRLPSELLIQLSEHFSADYEDLMVALTALEAEIQRAAVEKVSLPHVSDLYPTLSSAFVGLVQELDVLLEARKSEVDGLGAAVAEKKVRAFSKLDCPQISNRTTEIDEVIARINLLIAEHNGRTTEFDAKREEAFEELENHYAASFVVDHQYNAQVEAIASLNAVVVDQTAGVASLNQEIRELERELSATSRGAEQVNDLLKAHFGKDDLRLVVSDDSRFSILRRGVLAKNLSEGEKTAIAFAYFVTRVSDGRIPLSDTIVVIDDPISSLDANHLFNTYAIIKIRLSGCLQLFVSTHSFEFFHLLREWAYEVEKDKRKQPAQWSTWRAYWLCCRDDGHATLEILPKELAIFNSEYHYLFSRLYHFSKARPDTVDLQLSLPNVVRRFMEAFGGIMIPLASGLRKKMERLFPDEIERERVWRFINHFSHNSSVTRSLAIPDLSECQIVVAACLKAVRAWNEAYYLEMESEVI